MIGLLYTPFCCRYWSWGKKDEVQDKFHVLNKGETLITVSKFHNLPMADLMKWNGITEPNQIYIGMRLIVRKANPDEPTKAEILVSAKEMKKHAGQGETPLVGLTLYITPSPGLSCKKHADDPLNTDYF